jgi:hypothetical protein
LRTFEWTISPKALFIGWSVGSPFLVSLVTRSTVKAAKPVVWRTPLMSFL